MSKSNITNETKSNIMEDVKMNDKNSKKIDEMDLVENHEPLSEAEEAILTDEEQALNILVAKPLKSINKLIKALSPKQLISAKSNIDKRIQYLGITIENEQIHQVPKTNTKPNQKVKAALQVAAVANNVIQKTKQSAKASWIDKLPEDAKFMKGDIVYIRELDKFGIFEYYSFKRNKCAVSLIKKHSKTDIMTRPWIFNHKKIQLAARNGQLQSGFSDQNDEYEKI